MPERLAVDEKNQLQEYRESVFPKQPLGLRVVATIISVIFHPAFLPIYVVLFMLYIHPYLYAGFADWDRTKVLIQAIVGFTFFPVVTILLLKALHFIKSIQLRTQRDRIIPFVACGIYYFWTWNVWRHLPDYPVQAIQFALAIFIASWMGLLANIYMKVSMHAISMGVILTFMILLGFEKTIPFSAYISVTLLLVGLVCTSRFIISDHTPKEVYIGLFVGVLAQLIGHWLG